MRTGSAGVVDASATASSDGAGATFGAALCGRSACTRIVVPSVSVMVSVSVGTLVESFEASIGGWRARGRMRSPRRCCAIPRIHDRQIQLGVGKRVDMFRKRSDLRSEAGGMNSPMAQALLRFSPQRRGPQLHHQHRPYAQYLRPELTHTNTIQTLHRISLKSSQNVIGPPSPVSLPPPPARTPRQRPNDPHRTSEALRRFATPETSARTVLYTIHGKSRQPGSTSRAIHPIRAGATHVRNTHREVQPGHGYE